MQHVEVYLGHCVGKQAVQQPVRVLPLHGELCKGRQVNHPHLLHHQLALSADWPEPVGASETGPERHHRRTRLPEEPKKRGNAAVFSKYHWVNLFRNHCPVISGLTLFEASQKIVEILQTHTKRRHEHHYPVFSWTVPHPSDKTAT